MFIRYNPVAKYYEYSTDITRRGKGPWLILPIDYTQIYNLPPIPPPYVLPANVALKDQFNAFTALNYFQNRIVVFGAVGTDYSTAPIEIQTIQPPRISFHWPGVVASQIGMDSAGIIRTYNNPGTGYEKFAAADITSYGTLTSTGNTHHIGNLHGYGGLIFPTNIVTSGGQASWWLASHPSYGLYANTGLYLGGNLQSGYAAYVPQVAFPAAQEAHSNPNFLDDYEEGNYTPAFYSSGGGSSSYDIQAGNYTKIGNMVSFNFDLRISSYGFAEGPAYVTLPFVASGTYGIHTAGYFTITNPVSWIGGITEPPNALMSFRFIGGGGSSGTGSLYIGNIGPGGRIVGGGTYRTAT